MFYDVLFYSGLVLTSFLAGQVWVAFGLIIMTKREFIETINDLREEQFVSYSD